MLQDAIEFYYKACSLKEMIRQGSIKWGVKTKRHESIAEHIYGTTILAIAIKSELKLDVDLNKVLYMLIIHEFEEIKIGDVTTLDGVNKKDLEDVASKFVNELVENLSAKEDIVNLTNEFNGQQTKESKFAVAIDKLECVLEFKKYQDRGQVSLTRRIAKKCMSNPKLAEYKKANKYDIADIFFIYHKEYYQEFGIDENYWFTKLKNLKIDYNN